MRRCSDVAQQDVSGLGLMFWAGFCGVRIQVIGGKPQRGLSQHAGHLGSLSGFGQFLWHIHDQVFVVLTSIP